MMRSRPGSLLGLLFILCSACTPQLSDAQAERIATEARHLLYRYYIAG